MADKSIEDMTASELLRWAALDERDKFQNITPQGRLLSALAGSDYVYTDSCCRRDLFRQLADKIDAEISDACLQAVLEYKKSMWWFKSAIARGEDWPEPREGEKFRDYLSRCFVLRPRFEDGEPVQWVDPGIDWGDGKSWAFNAIDQAGQAVALGQDNIAARSTMTENGRVKRASCKALGADGLPLVSNEVVFIVPGAYSDGLPPYCGELVVVDTKTLQPLVALRDEPPGERELYRVPASSLTHTPPDTQRKINADVTKNVFEYWGCGAVLCDDCPMLVDGKRPREWLGAESCHDAKVIDLLRRQRELDKRTGGAE